jgi:hypothetical protein
LHSSQTRIWKNSAMAMTKPARNAPGPGIGRSASSAETQMLAAENTASSGAVFASGNRSFW